MKMLKRFILVLFLISFTMGFTVSDLNSDHKKNDECPYLKGLMIKLKKSESDCPYLKGELKCPYLKKDKDNIKEINYELIEKINS